MMNFGLLLVLFLYSLRRFQITTNKGSKRKEVPFGSLDDKK